MLSLFLKSKWILFCILIACCSIASAKNEAAGEVEFARGAATIQRSGEPTRILGQGQNFYQGEVLSTSKKSFAVIRLGDGSRLTLRPNTQFVVEDLNADKSTRANAVLRLFKGGVRAVTGFISKFNKNGYKLETPIATMGIRGTEFDARICEGDCEENGDSKTVILRGARVAFAKGQVSLAKTGGSQLPVKTGSNINAGERISSGRNGVAVLVFPDNSRVTLQPRSEFIIRDYGYDKDKFKNSKSVFELLRGGLRAVTGLIGKYAADNYEMRTPVATIGIRGTGFDLLCKGSCVEARQSYWQPKNVVDRLLGYVMRNAHAQSVPANGMYAYVWSGSIQMNVQGKRFTLGENRAAFIVNQQSKPIDLPSVPDFILKNPHPRPDNVIADPEKIFSQRQQRAGSDAGLYVSVYDGEVQVGDTRLRKGNSSFTGADNRVTRRLNEIPAFIARDPFPKPTDFKPSVYRLLDTLEEPQKSFECEM